MLANRNTTRLTFVLVGALIIGAMLSGCTMVQPVQANSDLTVSAQAPSTTPAAPTVAALSDEEVAGLLYMREEEKLAHDVYVTLYEQWELRNFANIARSEQQHTDAVRTLLDQYGITDPASGNALGVFVDPALQALYDELIAQGRQSLIDAVMVGNIIEETDILDLQTRIAQTDHADIAQLYNQLLRGSSNHLRAFSTTWERMTGESYVPQYLDQENYDTLIGGSRNGGPGNGSHGTGSQGKSHR